MPRNDWDNTVMDARKVAMDSSLAKADRMAKASHPPSAAMKPVVTAASGPAESAPAPLVDSSDREKVQP